MFLRTVGEKVSLPILSGVLSLHFILSAAFSREPTAPATAPFVFGSVEQIIRLSLLIDGSISFLSDRFELRNAFFHFSDPFFEQGHLDVAIG